VKKFLLGVSIVAATAFNATQAVEITMNGGAVTQYIFRGVPQSDGKVGDWGNALKGNYIEIGYGNPEQDTFFYAGVTKSFDLFSN